MAQNRPNFYKSLMLFILTAVLLALAYPNKSQFKYQFTKGRPWKYDLLTAPFDFPVMKSSDQIQFEKDSVLRSLLPYYSMDETVLREIKTRLSSDYHRRQFVGIDASYLSYVIDELETLYNEGVLSHEGYKELERAKTKSFILVDLQQVAKRKEIQEVSSTKQVYEQLLENCPRELKPELLRGMDLDRYLKPNFIYNKEMTAKVEKAKLEEINARQGKVQAGERIVNTGDLVTSEIYMQLSSLKRIYETRSGTGKQNALMRMGYFLVCLSVLLMFWGYLVSYRRQIVRHLRNVFFFLFLIIFFVLLTELAVSNEIFNVYILAYATLPILVRTFFDSRTALFAHMVNVILAAIVAPYPLEFIVIQFMAGGVAILTLYRLTQRSDLVRSSFYVLLACILSYVSFTLFQESSFTAISWRVLLYFLISFVFLMFAYVMVYVLERVFGYVSNISLVELSDINSPTLRKLSEMAPGTFQHSLQVSILATEAASRIGADVQLVRTGALYHDIGKMRNPLYFTENQGVSNPHDKLSYEESAKIIIRHVTDGVEMAEKINLPQAVINFIQTHHGLGKTKYFYNSWINEHPNEVVDESIFTYPGPNPYTKEQGILMLADSVEASSRSLKEFTEEKMVQHIDRIVDGIVEDGLLKNTPLTFKDVEIIKEVFYEKLKTMYHSRISYPELRSDATVALAAQ